MNKTVKNILLYLGIQGICFGIIGIPLVFKGPFTNIKENWVLTAMTTMSHQYLATMFVSAEEIDQIIEKHKIDNDDAKSNIDDIQVSINSINKEVNIYDQFTYPNAKTIYKEDGIKVDEFREGKFKAYVAIIDDPSRVKVSTTKSLGTYGEKLVSMTNRRNAILGVNAGGFVDTNGKGTGGVPLGIVIQDSEVVYKNSSNSFDIVGFNKDNVLVIGKYSMKEIEKLNLRDAITFRPLLIVNGEPQITQGNGGWGIAPRTAIGQRKDGKVVMLVIDGRQTSSVGATLKEVQDIMLAYGCYNCANLDGGSSSEMVLNNKTINNTSSKYGPRNLATAFIVE